MSKINYFIQFYLGFLSLFLVSTHANALKMYVPPEYKHKLSAIIIDSANSKIVYTYNANTPRLIASNMKLFTSLFALQVLKPTFRWPTKLYHSGTIQNAAIVGNLYIEGGGDPSLTRLDIQHLLKQLKQYGIKHINGNIVIDESIFNSTPKVSMLEYADYDSDMIMPHGLIIDGNLSKFKLTISNGQIRIHSNLYQYTIINRLTLDAKKTACQAVYKAVKLSLNDNSVTLTGSISPQCKNLTLVYNLASHTVYNNMLIKQALDKLKISVTGDYKNAKVPVGAKLIATHYSKDLAQILIEMNKNSNNLTAETLINTAGAYVYSKRSQIAQIDKQHRLLALGKERNQEAQLMPMQSISDNNNTFVNGGNLFKQFLAINHLDNPKFHFENGAGLSRYEYLSVQNIADLLLLIKNSDHYNNILLSLPVPGQEGTLRNSLLAFKKSLHAKTGALNDTRAYSGYYYAPNGKVYIIAIVINNFDAQDPATVTQFDQWVTMLLKQLNN